MTNLIVQVCSIMHMLGFKQLDFTMVCKCYTVQLVNSGHYTPSINIQLSFYAANCHKPVTTYFSVIYTAYRGILVNCVGIFFFSSWVHIH
jgi:hypothetical protein